MEQIEKREADASVESIVRRPPQFRMAWKMMSGRTSFSHWMDKETVWQLIYTNSNLVSGEWLGVQEKDKAIQIVKRGPWFNPDKRE